MTPPIDPNADTDIDPGTDRDPELRPNAGRNGHDAGQNRRRSAARRLPPWLAATAAVAVAVSGIGGAAVAAAGAAAQPGAAPPVEASARSHDADRDGSDRADDADEVITIEELADLLDQMGLELRLPDGSVLGDADDLDGLSGGWLDALPQDRDPAGDRSDSDQDDGWPDGDWSNDDGEWSNDDADWNDDGDWSDEGGDWDEGDWADGDWSNDDGDWTDGGDWSNENGDWNDGDWDDDGPGPDADQDEHGDHGDHEGGGDQVIGSGAVDGDRLDTSTMSPEVAEKARSIWDRFVALVPADQRQMVSGFELNPGDGGAYVYPDDDDPTRWVLGVSENLGRDLDYVLIHEFAHLLTLQAKEVPPGPDTGSCPTYHTGEGCALKGSTFAEFVARFWPADLRAEAEAAYENDDFESFWQKYQDRFVTDYAASNPAEDLAEVFAHFVLTDRPTGDGVADQKIEFLWNDPDMVELRDQIRSADPVMAQNL